MEDTILMPWQQNSMEEMLKHMWDAQIEKRYEDQKRMTGRTIRQADKAIQFLFDYKTTGWIKDHTNHKTMNKYLFNLIQDRLKREHPHIAKDMKIEKGLDGTHRISLP